MGYAILWLRVRAEFMEGKIQTFLDVNLLKGDRKQLWVNPDCGLKTREWSQVRQPCLDGQDALEHVHCWLALPFCTGCLHWMGCGCSLALCLSMLSPCSVACGCDMAWGLTARCCRRWRTWSRRPPTRAPRSELPQHRRGAKLGAGGKACLCYWQGCFQRSCSGPRHASAAARQRRQTATDAHAFDAQARGLLVDFAVARDHHSFRGVCKAAERCLAECMPSTCVGLNRTR